MKQIPLEQLIMLYNQISTYSARNPMRKKMISQFADSFDISAATVRRQLRVCSTLSNNKRVDFNKPRVVSVERMQYYCKLIAALKLRTSNKKGRHLSSIRCIKILEEHGIEANGSLIKVPIGLLKKSTINRYLKTWGFDNKSLNIEPTVVRFEAKQSNDCWQFDFSQSDLKRIGNSKKTLMIASVIDDRSGILYSEYHEVTGEDVMTVLRFLFNAMSPKKEKGILFQGIPKMLYIDNGSFAKSALFKRVMKSLGIEVKCHLPRNTDGRRTTARSKGKVERSNRTVKESFEPLYHIHKPSDVKEANTWLCNYIRQYNNMQHRREDSTRLEVWKNSLPKEGFKKICSWTHFCKFVHEPEKRIVGSDACVSVNGVKYQLNGDMAGNEVTLLYGIIDQELHVEFNNVCSGPFYPISGPIPLHTYRKFKKSDKEKQTDEIADLASKLSIPISVLNDDDTTTQRSLSVANIINDDEIPYVPFDETISLEFNNKIEAKAAIAKHLGKALSELNDMQRLHIESIINKTLNQKVVFTEVSNYFNSRKI